MSTISAMSIRQELSVSSVLHCDQKKTMNYKNITALKSQWWKENFECTSNRVFAVNSIYNKDNHTKNVYYMLK